MIPIQSLPVWKIILRIALLLIPAAESLARLPSPTLLFHAGSAQILAKNIERRGISQEDWDRFIMPLKEGQTNFNLRPYRQGLYGAQTIADVGLYSYYKMQNGIEPQIMAIQLKAVCAEPPHRFGANYQIKPVDSKWQFSVWMDQNKQKYSSLQKQCLSDGSNEKYHYWRQGELYSAEAPAENDDSEMCTDVLQDFLTENDIKLVLDVVNNNSWYIRDRNCIETIHGTADELIKMVLENRIGDSQEPVFRNLYGDSMAPGYISQGITFVFLRALSKTNLLDNAHLDRWSTIFRELDSYLAEGEKIDDPTMHNNWDNFWIFRKSLLAAIAAIETQTVDQFQEKLSRGLDVYLSGLKESCAGKNGVPDDKIAGCVQRTRQETRKLLQLLR